MALTQAQRQERTRSLLVQAAQNLLAENQVDASISEICKQAGVAVGTFYNYYESKQALFDDAAIEALIAYHPTLQAIGDRYDDPALGVLASMRFSCRMATHNPRLARIILNAGPRAFTDISEYGAPPRMALEASVKRGLAKCDDVVAFLVALSGTYQNALAFSMQNPDYKPEQADYAIAIYARALGYDEETVAKVCFGPTES